ncbi:MAG: PhzF family phenazine biosynthesis protein [Pseudomonadota bacterium]
MDSGLEGEQRRVRYFSPQVEVSFCGHATVAAGVLLGRLDAPRGAAES